MTVVLATCAALPNLDIDDQKLHRALIEAGIPAEIAVWDNPSVDWSQYAMCVIRSTWDYVPKREQYVAWAESIASQTVLWNPAPLIRWNTDKAYLKLLAAQGIPIVETVWVEQGSQVDFDSYFQQYNWSEMVLKPVISASGKDTFKVTQQTLPTMAAEMQLLLSQRDLMVQPFLRSVESIGELSLLFFNGEFSHGLTKVPAPDEFRVQEHFGGITRLFQPSPAQRKLAEDILGKLPWPTLYARVDLMVDDQGKLCLSELELTEPSMFLAYDPEAVHRFVRAITTRLSQVPKADVGGRK